MTEIKIQFTKTEVEKYAGDDKPANAESLGLKIMPIFFEKFYEEVPPDTVLTKVRLGFFDGAEKEIYNNLLDDKKDKFELSFEKESVCFHIVELGKGPEDENKLLIEYIPLAEATLRIIFRPKFAGVVKITPLGKQQDDKDQNDNKDNKNDKQKIDELEAKIKDLEKKLQNKDNSEDQKKVKELKKNKTELEINSLQKKIKEVEDKIKNTDNSTEKDNYRKELDNIKKDLENKEKEKDKLSDKKENNQSPSNSPYLPWIIGGGAILFILLIVIIILLARNSRQDK